MELWDAAKQGWSIVLPLPLSVTAAAQSLDEQVLLLGIASDDRQPEERCVPRLEI